MSVSINFSRTISPETAWDTFTTVVRSRCSTWARIVVVGVMSQYYSPRTIGAWAGVISSLTAIFWAWAHYTGRLPEPKLEGIDPNEVEVHGEQTV